MKKVKMESLYTSGGGGNTTPLAVPGGWYAWVPEMSDPEYTTALTLHYLQHGASQAKAKAEAERVQSKLASIEFLKRLRLFIKRNAETYARNFPRLVNGDGSLRGFDPESLQRVFVPYDSAHGRAGKIALRKALAGMAAEQGELEQFDIFESEP